jgi:hypothetical protein
MIESSVVQKESWLSPQAIAKKLDITPETVINWLKDGDLKGYKFAGLWRVEPGDYRKFLDEHCNRRNLTPGEQRCYDFIKSRYPWPVEAGGSYIPYLLAHQIDPNDLYRLIGLGLVKANWIGDLTIQLVTLEADQSG